MRKTVKLISWNVVVTRKKCIKNLPIKKNIVAILNQGWLADNDYKRCADLEIKVS